MDILHLIDVLEELVAGARRIPVGQGIVLDRRRLLELIDQMRSTVPWEVQEAQEIVAEKEGVLEEARREGEGIVHKAELDAQALLDETSILQAAEREAQEIIGRADARAAAILEDAQQQTQAKIGQAEQAAANQMDEADRYALEMLRRLDQQLAAFSSTVRSGIESLELRSSEAVGEPEPVPESGPGDAP